MALSSSSSGTVSPSMSRCNTLLALVGGLAGGPPDCRAGAGGVAAGGSGRAGCVGGWRSESPPPLPPPQRQPLPAFQASYPAHLPVALPPASAGGGYGSRLRCKRVHLSGVTPASAPDFHAESTGPLPCSAIMSDMSVRIQGHYTFTSEYVG